MDLKEKNKIENKYDMIEFIDDPEDLKCCFLTSRYLRCQQKVKYNYKDLNKSGEKNKNKKNLHFSTTHINTMAKDNFKKDPRYGFYFESDLYK